MSNTDFFCRGCRSFKPKYITLAEEVFKERPDIEFYAVSCVANKETCSNYKISGYPSIFTFPANSKDGTLLKRSINPLNGYKPADILKALNLPTGTEDSELDDGNDDEETSDESKTEEEEDEESDEENEEDPDNNLADNEGTEGEEKKETPKKTSLPMKKETSVSNLKNRKDIPANKKPSDTSSAATETKAILNTTVTTPRLKSTYSADVVTAEEAVDSVEENSKGEESESDTSEETDDDRKDEENPNDSPPYGSPRQDSAVESGVTSNRASVITKPGRVYGAGAALASHKPHVMDRWRDEIAQRKSSLETSFTVGKFGSIRPGKYSKLMNSLTPSENTVPGTTMTMLANTPGTEEFAARRKRNLERIQKFKNKREKSFLKHKKPVTPEMEDKMLMKKNLPFKLQPRKPNFVQKQAEKVPGIKRMFKMSKDEELILDASLSFVIGLKHGIFTSNDPLTDEKKEALKSWLNLMSVGLPPEWGLHTLIDDLSVNIELISQKDANLLKILDKYPIPRQKWSKSCDTTGIGGFSCGMWKLIHIMSIGVAEHKGGRNLIDANVVESSTRVFSPADVADTIREYIYYFFGCKECRDNFISEYDQCSFRRCDRLSDDAKAANSDDWKQVALWIWEVHNSVSVRVANEKVTRSAKKLQMSPFRTNSVPVIKKNDEIQSLWPTLETCLSCFDMDGKWNEASVFAFLERTYWSDPDEKTGRLLLAHNTDHDISGVRLIWVMLILAIGAVLFLWQHLNKSSGLRKTLAAASTLTNSVSAISIKFTDQVAGKRTTKEN